MPASATDASSSLMGSRKITSLDPFRRNVISEFGPARGSEPGVLSNGPFLVAFRLPKSLPANSRSERITRYRTMGLTSSFDRVVGLKSPSGKLRGITRQKRRSVDESTYRFVASK